MESKKEIDQRRIRIIESSIIREMKTFKVFKASVLYERVKLAVKPLLNKLATSEEISLRIDYLIEQEYLEAKENLLYYIT